MSQCFRKSLSHFGKTVNDLFNYATKSDVKKGTNFDASASKKVDLISRKSDVDRLDIDKLTTVQARLNNLKINGDKVDSTKLQTVPVDWKKRSDGVDNEVVKKTLRDYLVSKATGTEAKFLTKTGFFNELQYDIDKQNI